MKNSTNEKAQYISIPNLLAAILSKKVSSWLSELDFFFIFCFFIFCFIISSSEFSDSSLESSLSKILLINLSALSSLISESEFDSFTDSLVSKASLILSIFSFKLLENLPKKSESILDFFFDLFE